MSKHQISHLVTHSIALGQDGYGRKLMITSSGEIAPAAPGANAVYAASDVSGVELANLGKIVGGAAGSGSGKGGAGVDFTVAGRLGNGGTIDGGHGGNLPAGHGIVAGSGGDAVNLAAGTLRNIGTVEGGIGGNGYDGGGGGYGVDVAGGSVANFGTIAGGTGGVGSYLAQDYYGYGGRGGTGVFLNGGTLVNHGTIEGGKGGFSYDSASDYGGGGFGGIGADMSSGILINDGVITGGANGKGHDTYRPDGAGVGIYLTGGMLLNNGTITGGTAIGDAAGGIGVVATGGTVVNMNAIVGLDLYGGSGINYGSIIGGTRSDGTLLNLGSISGGGSGVGAFIASGLVTNQGTITGGGGNQNLDSFGVRIEGGTLINDGTISAGDGPGVAGYAVRFDGSATLVVDPGAVFVGQVGNTYPSFFHYDDVMHLAGTTPGTLSGLGTQFVNFTSIEVDAGSNWSFTGTNTLSANTGFSDDGALTVDSYLRLGSVANGSGTLTLAHGASVIAPGTLGVATMAFAGGGAILGLGEPGSVTSTIAGFGSGDMIDLSGITATSLQYANGMLSVYDGATVVDALRFAGSYTTGNFSHAPDAHNGTDIGYVTT